MRKSTVIMMAILLAAFGALLAAADATLKPLAEDAGISKELTRDLENQERIEPGTKVTVLRVGPSPRRLAEEGRGLLVQLQPRRGRTSRMKGGLSRLASVVAEQAKGAFPAATVRWIEVVFELGEERRATLLRVDEGGRLGRPFPSPDPKPTRADKRVARPLRKASRRSDGSP